LAAPTGLSLGFKIKKAGLASGLNGDEVIIRLHRGAQKGDATNLGTLSEPRRKQNLYANPKRTAKSSPSLFQTPPA
jgi:hypothetical protein